MFRAIVLGHHMHTRTRIHSYSFALSLAQSCTRSNSRALSPSLSFLFARSFWLARSLSCVSRVPSLFLYYFLVSTSLSPLSLPPPSPSPLTHHFLSHTYLPIRTQVHNAADMSKGWKVLLTVESAQMMTEQAVNPYILCTLEAKGKGSRVEVSRKTSAGTHHTQVQHTYNTHKARIQQIHNTPHTIHTNTRTHALAWCIQIHPCLQTVEM